MNSTDLYQNYAKDFSNSRNFYWKGWERILSYINSSKPIRVLDLGAGNGRFLKFLKDNQVSVQEYVAVDNSKEMLDLAKENLSELNISQTFILQNLEEEWIDAISGEFDLIVAFGVFHHLKSEESRANLFKFTRHLLSPEGTAVITAWQFKNLKNFKSKIIRQIGEEDFILSFGENAKRFCHNFTIEEQKNILQQNKIRLKDEFESDGAGGKLNRYFLFSKV
jgi:cyclopropane fatty-acyl-phospholipid synthase-like methyltransferase